MLCAAGIGSAEALAQVLKQDPDFLSDKVPCASVTRHLALTRVLQLSLTQPQVDCITAYLRSSAAAHRNRLLLAAAAAAGFVAAFAVALKRLNRHR